MASKKLMDMLNEAIALELAVSIQYMWHHVMAKGLESPEVRDRLREIAIQEMKHAEDIAERLDYLGGVPTAKPAEIKVGGSLKQMLQDDLKAEEEAIAFYKKIIKQAMEEDDFTTKRLFEQILADEEDHANEFSALLGK